MIINGEKYKLSDFTGALPSRHECNQMKFRTLLSRNYLWNRDYYHKIDELFLNSALRDHYRETIAVMGERTAKDLKGMMLSQCIKIMLVHLENPQLQGELGITPMVYAVSVLRASFIRKYLGVVKYWKRDTERLKALEPITANMPKTNFTKAQMMSFANDMFDIIRARALQLQPAFRREIVNKGLMLP